MKAFEDFIHQTKYARWNEEEQRRETWDESIDRIQNFFLSDIVNESSEDVKLRVIECIGAIRKKEVMPSMRLFSSAGEALRRENLRAYNCSYTEIDNTTKFAEEMYLSMCGVGAGFNVQKKFVSKIKPVPSPLIYSKNKVVTVQDSAKGWAQSLKEVLDYIFDYGIIPTIDYSLIRPKGARLVTSGGFAPGPEPLKKMFRQIFVIIEGAVGRQLKTLEAHDICCIICEAVVSGGIRRSAAISLSDLSDHEILNCKNGNIPLYRYKSNNSTAYEEKPSLGDFLPEMISLTEGNSGERGIVNVKSLAINAPERRDKSYQFGVNPCVEAVLRGNYSDEYGGGGLCNLTEVVIRKQDSLNKIKEKIKKATILGVLQSTLTNFDFVSEGWKLNAEEERLLGVSLTGLCDHEILKSESPESIQWLKEMKQTALDTAEEWSEKMDINMPAMVTVVKPSGTVSLLVDCSAGIHPRYYKNYISRVTVDVDSSVFNFLRDRGVPYIPGYNETEDNMTTALFEFPIKSPSSSCVSGDKTAIEQMDYWLMIKKYWCEGNPSCTIKVKKEEWLDVYAWVYKNWDYIGGLSFFLDEGNIYDKTPYQEVSDSEIKQRLKDFPKLDFTELSDYEKEDKTETHREIACSGGTCDLNI